MTTRRPPPTLLGTLGLALALACVASIASAQGRIDAKLMQRYGGVLAPECGNYLLPQLKYLGDSLVVQDGGKPILTGRNVKAVPTYFGKAPPPEFETALTSEIGGGDALVFVLYRNASGLYAAVEGGPKTMAALPAAFRGKRTRHCDPNRNLVPGAPVPVELGPTDMLKDAKFRRPYLQALGPLAKDVWLTELEGPAPPVRKVQVGGVEYQLVGSCKIHDCADNSVVLLYAAPSQTVYGKVWRRGVSTFIGAPPAPVAAEIERLWKAEWRRGQ